MVLLNNFDPFEDFWQSNPQLRVLFKDEYKARVSSQYMWALFLYGHPSSKFFNETPQTRKDLIYKDYLLSDPAFKWEDYDSTLKTLEEHCLTKAQRSLMRWEKSLHEREDFMDTVPYTTETYKIKDEMLANTPKLWASYEAILERLTKEESAQTFGDQEESLSEKGEI